MSFGKVGDELGCRALLSLTHGCLFLLDFLVRMTNWKAYVSPQWVFLFSFEFYSP